MARLPSPRHPGRPPRSASPLSVVPPAKADDDDASDPQAAAADDVPAGPPPTDSLSEMMAGLQGAANSRVCIYRIVKNEPPRYVAECAPESFSLDDLRDKYRGGEFRLYIMKEGKLWKNMRVVVEPPTHEPSASAASSAMGDVLAVMRDGFQAQAAAMRELAARPTAPSPFGSLDLPAVITAISGAIVALRPPPAPVPPPAADTSTAIDMFIQGITLARELREDSGGPADNSIGGMLREVLRSPLMAQAVQAAAAPAVPVSHAKTPGTPALPQPQPPSQQPPAPPASGDAQMSVLHHYYGMLCQKAAGGADPTLYADLVLDNVDDDTLNALLSRQPTPLDALIAEYPPAAQHRDWFAALIESLMQAMSEEQPESDGQGQAPIINGAGAPDAAHAQAPVVPGQPS